MYISGCHVFCNCHLELFVSYVMLPVDCHLPSLDSIGISRSYWLYLVATLNAYSICTVMTTDTSIILPSFILSCVALLFISACDAPALFWTTSLLLASICSLLACVSCCFNCPFKCMSPAVCLLNFILGEKHQTLYCPLAIICSHWNTSTLVCGLSVSCCHTEC